MRLALVLALIAAFSGCSNPDPPDPEFADRARRERHRAALRDRLGEVDDAPLPPASIDRIQRGAKLYDRLCASCHGRTGKGDGPSAAALAVSPRNLSSPEVASFYSDRAKLVIIAEGIPGTPMIGWSHMLGERERLDVLQFMNTLVREP